MLYNLAQVGGLLPPSLSYKLCLTQRCRELLHINDCAHVGSSKAFFLSIPGEHFSLKSVLRAVFNETPKLPAATNTATMTAQEKVLSPLFPQNGVQTTGTPSVIITELG